MIKGNLWNSFKTNKVVRNFVISDLVLFGGWGLISPVMSIFVIENIEGASLITVGALALVYWVVRSAIELPMAIVIEKTETEKDDMYVLISGLLLISVSAFWLSFVETIPQLFLFQAVYALGFALYAAAWSGIFSRHIDKSKAAISWAVDHTLIGIATGVTGILGGYIAQDFGFSPIFFLAGMASFVAAVLIFIVPEMILPGKKSIPTPPTMDHSPKTAVK
ncbi:MAG: MFS transporter [Candidatus Colwellbacteria bacterium]|nr:MFS transporter [Candidatus Colwellbacteria bacterium]